MNGTLPGVALLSVVTAAYNEAENLPLLYTRLKQVLTTNWEWIVVDDHSSDETFTVLLDIAHQDRRVRALRLARNSGSHTALTCGLREARGDCAVVIAADLQDPPEVLPELMAKWREGAQVVWAVRAGREGEKTSTVGFARFYYWMMRNIAGVKQMPASGADFFLLDKRVVDALRQFDEKNVSLMALITWMGFRQVSIPYVKQARLYGRSGWSLGRKIKLVVDSLTSFSYLPIRLMAMVGIFVALVGFLYAILVSIIALSGRPPQGWSSLMVIVLVVGGIQMVMMGILGEYLWRALDETRRRPRYLIEANTDEFMAIKTTAAAQVDAEHPNRIEYSITVNETPADEANCSPNHSELPYE
jgi:polyisoprenyl-phosphate glycosyltransferase